MPTLYLIDGYAQFFRAYHAIRTPMTSPVTKEPTNMTFGFIGMLLKLLRCQEPGQRRAGKPDYLAVTLDVSGDQGTFRSQLYSEYKANRPPPPEDLFPQVDRCIRMLSDLGIPTLGVEGFEADDVLATLVTRLRAQHPDLRIRIVSKDKDLKQLLASAQTASGDEDALVALFDVHTDLTITAQSFEHESGIKPAQVIDMLSLMGDTVDNVPGVEGVGEKTASSLIKEWGTLDHLLANADKVKGKRGEKLREAAPRLGLSRQLVALRHDVPLDFTLEHAATNRIDLPRLIPILKELGFNRYQDEVRAMTGSKGGLLPNPPEQPVTPEEMAEWSRGRESATAPAPKRAARSADADVGGGLFADIAAKERLDRPLTAQSGTYECIQTRDALSSLVTTLSKAEIISIDTETTSLVPRDAKLCGICLSTSPGRGYYIPIRSPEPATHLDEPTVLAALGPILEDSSKPKCGHNLKYDLLVLRNAGVELRGIAAPLDAAGISTTDTSTIGMDSMVASYLIDASRSSHSLDALALALLSRTNISISELIGSGKHQRTFDTVPVDQATQYAAEDADVALQLRNIMQPQLDDMNLRALARDVEMPLVEVLAELEWNGILVEPGELDRQRERLQKQIDVLLGTIRAEFTRALGRAVDPDSPKQLAVALFGKPEDDPPGLGIKGQKRTKTGFSTDAEVLESLAEDDSIGTPIPKLILEYRQLTKLVSTYLVALKDAIHPSTGRIHASFNQTVAVTGRLASSDPNLQNIPIRTDVGREIRKAFIAPARCVLIAADYSQIELRLLAHLSRDPALTQAFHDGQDIHTAVAAQIHNIRPEDVTREQRSGAKMVNFGIVYGITAYGLARRLKIGDKEAAAIIDGYKRRFSGITTFLQECVEQARSNGYVETMLKRRRPIPDIDSTNPSRRAFAERTAINSVVQGSAADLIKLAMVDLHARLSEHAAHRRSGRPPELPGVRMLLQIHDELVFESTEAVAPQALPLIRARMEAAMTLSVPLVADAHIARNWHEAK